MFQLRDYQQEAVNAALDWLKKSFEPCLIEAATGAGKSLLVAKIAEWLNQVSGKKVLCLAPSKELVEQNHEKYLALGRPASIYCASINKSMVNDVVFGSPMTVKNNLEKFADQFCAVVIDEAHEITPTIKEIVNHIRKHNPKMRVLGLTATPYRLTSGYIYQYDVDNNPVEESQTRDPYFNKLIYKIGADYLIEQGYLTRPHADTQLMEHYDTAQIKQKKNGLFDQKSIEQAFEGKGRKTSLIVADIVDKSQFRMGVMIFAATRQHASEIMESLPPDNSRMITGETKARDKIITDFKARRFKYLVSIGTLTRGFDASHVDVVAIMRATESVALLQQIIGRGLRLNDNKLDCLILDYAENIERHCPDGDLFNPEIKASRIGGTAEPLDAVCPECGTSNRFTPRPNDEGFNIDENGYFIDLLGQRIKTDDEENPQDMPAHFGRRCFGQSIIAGFSERCGYRWSSKECIDCGHHNDIAARYCEECKGELVDPNEKLKIEFHRIKADPYSLSTDKVLSWRVQLWNSQNGESVRIDYTTEYRTFPVWYSVKARNKWQSICAVVFDKYIESAQDFVDLIDGFEGKMPQTITCKKNGSFFEVYNYNEVQDEIPRVD